MSKLLIHHLNVKQIHSAWLSPSSFLFPFVTPLRLIRYAPSIQPWLKNERKKKQTSMCLFPSTHQQSNVPGMKTADLGKAKHILWVPTCWKQNTSFQPRGKLFWFERCDKKQEIGDAQRGGIQSMCTQVLCNPAHPPGLRIFVSFHMGEKKFEWKPPWMFFQPLSASLSLGQAPYYRHPAIMDEAQPPLSEIQSSKPLCTTHSDLPC